MKKRFLTLLLGIVLLTSCNTSKEIIYFQDIVVNQPETISGARDITVQPKDQISIMVSSKDPQLAALFNLTRVQYRAGSTDCVLAAIMEKYPAIRWMIRETLIFRLSEHCILPA